MTPSPGSLPPSTADSSVTITSQALPQSSRGPDNVDMEAQELNQKPVGHFSLILDQAGVTDAVINHKYRGSGTEDDPYLVEFLPGDPHNPITFKRWKKWVFVLLQAFACLGVAFVSTAYSGSVSEVIQAFNISTEVSILGISLFVVGFAIGPLLWAPLSELYGRQRLFFATYGIMTAFNAAATGSKNIQSLLILRFFAGAFGSSPLTNAGGVIADLFTANDRGMASAIFAAAPFLGPSLGPIVGGFVGEYAGWKWVLGVMAIFTGVIWIVVSLVVPETYTPVILRKRAAKLSKLTGKAYISRLDAGHGPVAGGGAKKQKSLSAEFKTALSRPWKLLFKEPIVLLTSLYMAIVYGTLYLMFAAFPIVFQQGRGWAPGIAGLPFLGLTVGMMFGVAYAIYDNKRYARVAAAHGGAAPPEARLPPGIIGSVLLPVGLFWFAWTNGPSIHWIVPIIASSFFAAGLVLVFLSLMNYLIDSYVIFAASVLAANSVIRSLFGAAFPLFTTYMYDDLGVHWASSVPAFLALACLPFPLLFYKYGAGIRMKCRYAAEAAAVLKRMRAMHSSEPVEDADEAEQEIERAITHEREERIRRSSTSHGGRHHSLSLFKSNPQKSRNKKVLNEGRTTADGGLVTDDEAVVSGVSEKE
ncbi:putative fluconazole resistance protein 1 protein [Zalerion maritima]|uniref:Fluconazole resistance protein 1 protein n=1 Tax=Zalerion maritima TaxID=339359 RepID=A0AAD5RUU1_9PEZI|nr:putative fluconazole resistance protein 1 protein [Zalerion maritima]